MSAVAEYVPFGYYGAQPFEWFIDRIALRARARPLAAGETSGHGWQARISEWKALQRDGWDVTVLLAGDGSHAVALGCRGDA